MEVGVPKKREHEKDRGMRVCIHPPQEYESLPSLTPPMRFLPNNRYEWIRLAFCASATTVMGMTCRIVALDAARNALEPLELTAAFYGVYGSTFLALAISSWAVRRSNPALARVGWITILVAGLLGGMRTPVY
jgi:hypothetical protein